MSTETNAKTFQQQLLEIQGQVESVEKMQVAEDKESKETAEAKEEGKAETIFDRLEAIGGPSKDEIEEWKSIYRNKVYAMAFDENEIYVYRYLTKPEHKQIMMNFFKLPAPQQTNDWLDEQIFDKCVLYPEVNQDLKLSIGAGTIDTIALQIRLASNFVPDNLAIEFVQKL